MDGMKSDSARRIKYRENRRREKKVRGVRRLYDRNIFVNYEFAVVHDFVYYL